MKFPYLKTPTNNPQRQWISRPIIPIMLIGPKGSIIVDALIDSGADKSMFNVEIGKEIGINLSAGEQEIFSGVEGDARNCFVHQVQMKIIGIDKITTIPAGFADSEGIFAILGQEGFFDSYKIKFEKNHNIIEINPAKKK